MPCWAANALSTRVSSSENSTSQGRSGWSRPSRVMRKMRQATTRLTAAALARRSALRPSVDVLDVARVAPGVGMVQSERVDRLAQAVVAVEAPVSGLAEAFGDAAGTGEKFDRGP